MTDAPKTGRITVRVTEATEAKLDAFVEQSDEYPSTSAAVRASIDDLLEDPNPSGGHPKGGVAGE